MRRRRRVSSSAAGLIALTLIAVVTFFVMTKSNPFANPFVVKAAFRQTGDMRLGSPVRIAGVDVGKVTGLEPGEERGSAVLEMEIKDAGLPLHRDATFKVRPRLFLEGNYFVDVQPGTPAAPVLEDGSLVPATQTAAPVSIGDLLKVFESDTRQDLRGVLRELGTALSGGGRGFNRGIRYWETAFRESARVNDATRGQQERDLSGYVRGAARVTEGLSRNRAQLRNLIANLAQTAGAFAREQAALSAAIRELPRTLRRGNRALAEVNEALPPLRTLARELTPVVRTSPATLDAAVPLARQLRGLFAPSELGGLARDVRVTAPALARFTRGGIELQGQQRLLASCQNTSLIPTFTSTLEDPNFPAMGPVYEELVKWLPGGAGGGRSFDGNGLYSRTFAPVANFVYPLNGRLFFNTQPLRGINPAPAELPPYRPTVPCETQEPPDLRSPALPPPPGLKANPAALGDLP
jgi:virulence factor Mce-like protein